jgi:hypothetical protein
MKMKSAVTSFDLQLFVDIHPYNLGSSKAQVKRFVL